ncbi:hypothetical protein EMCRGX_G006979 [Ephydatia muelleri]
MFAFNRVARAVVEAFWKGSSRSASGCCAPALKDTQKGVTGVGCPLCQAGLDRGICFHDDIQAGICPKMQRRIAASIKRSRKMGLLPNFKPEAKAAATGST